MGGGSKAPKQSDEEKALLTQQTKVLQQQLEAIKEQKAQFDLLAPFMFKDLGLKPIMEGGKITGFEEIPDPAKPLRQQSEKLLLERSIAALEGNLPVSKQLKEELAEGKNTLQESLRRTLGPDFLASTGGAEAMAKFMREEENVLEAARRGDITLGEQLGIAREASNRGGIQSTIASILGVAGAGGQSIDRFGNVAAGFGSAAQQLMQSRQLQQNFQLQSSQITPPWMAGAAGFGKLAGTLALAPTTGGGSLFGNLFG